MGNAEEGSVSPLLMRVAYNKTRYQRREDMPGVMVKNNHYPEYMMGDTTDETTRNFHTQHDAPDLFVEAHQFSSREAKQD